MENAGNNNFTVNETNPQEKKHSFLIANGLFFSDPDN